MQRVIAIVHLNDVGARVSPDVLRLILGTLRGVEDARFDSEAALVRVVFDHAATGLPDIVRLLEDTGLELSSVALRPCEPLATPLATRFGARHIRRRSVSHQPASLRRRARRSADN